MIRIYGDSNGSVELSQGQSWVVPGISVHVMITHVRWVDSSTAYVHIDIGDKQYGLHIKQRVWYNVGDIEFWGEVQISGKRLNHIALEIPDSWCDQINVEPTLQVMGIDAVLISLNNIPSQNRYGVGLGMKLLGTGIGNLKINWGSDYSETKTGLREGFYEFKETLPPGTHNICVDLFNVIL